MQIADFADLGPAEQKLIDHLRDDRLEPCEIGSHCPAAHSPADLTIRASLIRALIRNLVSDVPVPDRGIAIEGAFIRGDGPSLSIGQGLDFENI